jgi:hypothetical protein
MYVIAGDEDHNELMDEVKSHRELYPIYCRDFCRGYAKGTCRATNCKGFRRGLEDVPPMADPHSVDIDNVDDDDREELMDELKTDRELYPIYCRYYCQGYAKGTCRVTNCKGFRRELEDVSPMTKPYNVNIDNVDEYRLVAVRTYLVAPGTTPQSILQAIDAGMDSITNEDHSIEIEEYAHPRHLRITKKERHFQCSVCTGYPINYSGCWVKYVGVPKCRKHRNLVAHHKNGDDELFTLTSSQMKQYGQLAVACAQAIDDMNDTIDDATSHSIVPPLPEKATFIEECLFEEIVD